MRPPRSTRAVRARRSIASSRYRPPPDPRAGPLAACLGEAAWGPRRYRDRPRARDRDDLDVVGLAIDPARDHACFGQLLGGEVRRHVARDGDTPQAHEGRLHIAVYVPGGG